MYDVGPSVIPMCMGPVSKFNELLSCVKMISTGVITAVRHTRDVSPFILIAPPFFLFTGTHTPLEESGSEGNASAGFNRGSDTTTNEARNGSLTTLSSLHSCLQWCVYVKNSRSIAVAQPVSYFEEIRAGKSLS